MSGCSIVVFCCFTVVIIFMGLGLIPAADTGTTKFKQIYCAVLVIPLVAWFVLGGSLFLRALMEVRSQK